MVDSGSDIAAGIVIRPALADEIAALEQLIAGSARALSQGYYDDREIEAAIAHIFGVDSELIADGTYFVAMAGGSVAGCGGWSRRRTLFGGDRFAAREAGLLDPAVDAARIRAFFTAPGWQRRGVATALLRACEAAAAQAGFRRMALMATLPGVPFYAAHGYRPDAPIEQVCGRVAVRFTPMTKILLPI
jgi:GNAT superfamily N-acetyltransferase